MAINRGEICETCARGHSGEHCVQIGETVHIAGGREGDTDYSYYQCQRCGSVLLKIRDSGGTGGHGWYCRLLH